MTRPTNYRMKSLKQLLEAYAFEGSRINQEDSEFTKKLIKNEISARIKDAFAMLDNGADVESVYRQLIEH